MADEAISDNARAAAERLASELDSGLVADVEAALHTHAQTQRPEQYFDPISLGGLIVAVATLAWNIYNDLKHKTPSPAPDVVARTVRVKLGPSDLTSPEEQDRIIEVVVNETVQTAHK